MAKVTSKLQITIPKRLAVQYRINPGDNLEFVPAGDGIRLVRERAPAARDLSLEERLRLFDETTARQRARERLLAPSGEPPAARDWARDDLYTRDKPRR